MPGSHCDVLLPVLWICGPPGVGKSTVGWRLYRQLRESGSAVAYVDIDQLGMCYPEQPSDAGRHRLKARNLQRVVANFATAGAHGVVVSGVVDSAGSAIEEELGRERIISCRLDAQDEVIGARFLGRGGEQGDFAEVLADAEAMRQSRADIAVDTTGRSIDEVVGLIRARLGSWPLRSHGAISVVPAESAGNGQGDLPRSIVWVCGPTGVGKSAVGFAYYQTLLARGLTVGYLDSEQLGFYGVGAHELRAQNIAVVAQLFRAAGAADVVVSGPLGGEPDLVVYRRALPGAAITVCRLHATRDVLLRRITARGRGEGWAQPGDPLLGQPDSYLRAVAARAAVDAEALERATFGHRVDTSQLDTGTASQQVAAGLPTPLDGGRRSRSDRAE